MSISAITFDVDWAPEWAIEQCIELCRTYSVPATFFVTHPSPALQAIATDPLFELGIHPNFLPGSSHGSDFTQVLDCCLELVPSARSMRTHALVQSSRLFALVCDHYAKIETDVSLFLPNHPGLQPTELYLGDTQRSIVRLPYFWEDDVCAEWPGWSWSQAVPQSDGLRIFDFHPAYIALNMKRMQNYRQLKHVLGSRRLYEFQSGRFCSLHESRSRRAHVPYSRSASCTCAGLQAHFRHIDGFQGPYVMRVAIIGRTKMLLDSARALKDDGHKIGMVWTDRAESHYEANPGDFEELAAEAGALFACDRRINDDTSIARLREASCDIAISVNWINILSRDARESFRFRRTECSCG